MLDIKNIETLNFYERLGLTSEATTAEIRTAYRDLSKVYHPDRNPEGGDKIFLAIKEAYDALMDSDQRAIYDGKLSNQRAQSKGTGAVRDMYSDLFGKRSKDLAVKGKSKRVSITLTFEESLVGKVHTLRVPMESKCKCCHGKGQTVLGGRGVCQHCNGKGKIVTTTTNPMGRSISTEKKCPHCRTDVQNLVECEECKGTGSSIEHVTIDVDIPPVNNSTKLIVEGYGEEGTNGGERGDLVVLVSVANSSIFRRVENNLEYDAYVPYSTLLLGGTILVPTPNNPEPNLPINVAPCTVPGTVMRLPNGGAPDPHTGIRGALEVKLLLSLPAELTEEQRELASRIDF